MDSDFKVKDLEITPLRIKRSFISSKVSISFQASWKEGELLRVVSFSVKLDKDIAPEMVALFMGETLRKIADYSYSEHEKR